MHVKGCAKISFVRNCDFRYLKPQILIAQNTVSLKFGIVSSLACVILTVTVADAVSAVMSVLDKAVSCKKQQNMPSAIDPDEIILIEDDDEDDDVGGRTATAAVHDADDDDDVVVEICAADKCKKLVGKLMTSVSCAIKVKNVVYKRRLYVTELHI